MCDETVSEYLERTYNSDPVKRKKALKELCPCHVRVDIPEVWERIFEMCQDEDGSVRDQALHSLGDGSPTHLEERIVAVLEDKYNDPHPSVKKKARKMLNAYRKNGKWNVL
jgi:HEAT repeat protein